MPFTELPFWDPAGLECLALHLAKRELEAIGSPWSDWYFPVGQEIEICLVQLDARLGALHRRNTTHKCNFSPTIEIKQINTDHWLGYGSPKRHLHRGCGLKEFLTKEQAAACILDQKSHLGLPVKACNYDQVVMDLLNLQHESNDCGIMVQKDKSPSKVPAVVLQSLEVPVTSTSAESLITMVVPDKVLTATDLKRRTKTETIELGLNSSPPNRRLEVVKGISTGTDM